MVEIVIIALLAAAPGVQLDLEDLEVGTAPTGWYAPSKNITMRVSEETPRQGKRCLRLQKTKNRSANFMKKLDATPYRGRMIRFRSSVRVESGRAQMWVQVNHARGLGFFDKMEDRPITKSAWDEYEIVAPVPKDATTIMFGVLLYSDQSVWIDALSLEDVGSAPSTGEELEPAKPKQYGVTLLADEQLRVPVVSAAPIESSKWIRKHHHPLRSLRANDTSDLAFLAPLLKDKRVVQLGECSHGVREFSLAKVRMIRYLHEKLGYDVLAFEAGIFECAQVDRDMDNLPPSRAMRRSVFAVWHTQATIELFEYIRATRKTPRPLLFAGFDSQISSSIGAKARPEFLRKLLTPVDPQVADATAKMDRAFQTWARARTGDAAPWVAKWETLAKFIRDKQADIVKASGEPATLVRLVEQNALSMARYAEQVTAKGRSGSAIRDRAMADNFEVLLDDVYPAAKVIVWGHNQHLRHADDAIANGHKSMGTWLAERRRADLYTIGLYAHHGQAAMPNRALYPIGPAPDNGLEAVLHQSGRQWTFVDLSQATRAASTEWMFKPITARTWGTANQLLVPRDQYDALLLINETTPPMYR